ncbi:MAG: hypothetical protein RR704_23640, partial [Stenotrophomonas sp.]
MNGESPAYAGPWAGVFPAPAPVPSVSLPPRALRRLLGHFPTGVAIVCARDAQGNPQAGVPLKVQAVQHTTTTTRKRLV